MKETIKMDRIEDAIADFKEGKFVIVVDDEDRVGCPFAYLESATAVTTQKVTFTVKDNQEEAEVIEGAIIDVNGSRLKTNASGQAVFNLRAGTYPVKIRKAGFAQITETVIVASSAVKWLPILISSLQMI